MLRLQKELSETHPDNFFQIKRGEATPAAKNTITNDEIGRGLLSFDLHEPWSAHQIYKVFDEKYADIFGRPEVDSHRVVFVKMLLDAVDVALAELKNRPMASYALTKYFVLYALSRTLERNEEVVPFVRNPTLITASGLESFLKRCDELLKTIVVDLDFESSNDLDFDYKSVLKSPAQASDLAKRIIASYEKDVARDKAASFKGWTNN